MRKWIAVVLLAVIVAVLGGWLTVGKPVVKGVKFRWGTVNDSYTEIIANVSIYNPNPFPIPVKDVRAYVFMNGIEVGRGHAVRCRIPANSNSNLTIDVFIDNGKIPEWWVTHIRNGERTHVVVKAYVMFPFGIKFPVKFSRDVKTDILRRLSVRGPIPIEVGPIKLTLESAESRWGNVNRSYTEIITVAKIRNENPFPVPVTKVHYIVTMNGIRVADGYSDVSTVIPPNSDSTIPLITVIDNGKLIKWWVSHVRNGERSVIRVELRPYVQIDGKRLSSHC